MRFDDASQKGDLVAAWPGQAPEDFVQRVLTALLEDRRRRSRQRRWLAVAAAVLFFFFAAGVARQARSTAAVGAEDAYAQLVDNSALEAMLPD